MGELDNGRMNLLNVENQAPSNRAGADSGTHQDSSNEQPLEPTLDEVGFAGNRPWQAEEKTFEQKVDHSVHLLLANNLNRPALYQILRRASEATWSLFDLEDVIASMPEFANATQPPYFLIEWLVNSEALSFYEVDEGGNIITDEQRVELTEDEVDDLIADILVEITEVGREVLAVFNTSNRLLALFDQVPERLDTYREVLEFTTTKRSYAEIDDLLHGRPALMIGRKPDESPMLPSVYVDKLASAGGLVYDQGWIITTEGKEMLEKISEEKG